MPRSRQEELYEFLQEKVIVTKKTIETLIQADGLEAKNFLIGMSGLLMRLEYAMWCLNEGSYGTCSDCGGDIDIHTLRAEFQSSRCDSCFHKVHPKRKDSEL